MVRKSGKARQALQLFCHLNALILSYNSGRSLRVNKNVKEIKFDGVLG